MTVFFNFEKEKGEFTITLTKRGKVPLRQSDSGAARGLILDKEETRASIYVIKEMFPGKRLPIKLTKTSLKFMYRRRIVTQFIAVKTRTGKIPRALRNGCLKSTVTSVRVKSARQSILLKEEDVSLLKEQLYREGNA